MKKSNQGCQCLVDCCVVVQSCRFIVGFLFKAVSALLRSCSKLSMVSALLRSCSKLSVISCNWFKTVSA